MRRVGRRRFLLVTGAMLGTGFAHAQSPARVVRLALLLPNELWTEAPLRDALRRLGYVEGGNLAIERRSAGGDLARLPALAAELAAGKPDVLVAFLTQASIAAKRATSAIPIVMVGTGDPVDAGLVSNLARPGGNITGTTGQNAAVVGKQLELLRELKPGIKRVSVLWNPGNPVFQAQAIQEARAAAHRLGVRLDLAEASTQEELDRSLQALGRDRPDAVLVMGDPVLIGYAKRIAERLLALRLASVGGSRPYADAGLLAVYSPDLAESARRAAHIVDRVLKGTHPGDIPVEATTKFDLVVNLRTAGSLGIVVAPAVLARADELIR